MYVLMLFHIFISDLEVLIKSLLAVDIFADDTKRETRVNNEKAGSCTGPSGLLGKLGSVKQNPLNYRQAQAKLQSLETGNTSHDTDL